MARKRRGQQPRKTVATGAGMPVASPPQPRRRRIRRCATEMSGAGTKPTIRRVARRGGVKHMSGLMYEETRGSLSLYLHGLIGDTVFHTEHGYRTTVNSDNVKHAFRRSGRILYC
ncbi:hypothetical protein C8R44DRAFT_794936 [Mycena epipterygia]|nr:hypothetical protein C8R44DRAFT_794936 [Mycena epipterygia]